MSSTGPPPLQSQTGQRTFKVHGLETKFYGRSSELEVLYGALRRVVNDRMVHVVTVKGAAGLGKTRLVHEFLELIDHESRGITLMKTDSVSDEVEPSLRCTGQILQARFKVTPATQPDECRALLRQGLQSIVASERVTHAVNLLSYLVGLPIPEHTVPESHFASSRFHARALNTLFNLLRFDASKRPQIFIFDNLQWAPKQTLDILEGLISSLNNTAVLIVALSKQRLDSKMFEGASVSNIDVQPLDNSEMDRIVKHLLRRIHDLPDSFVEKTVKGAKGSPGLLEDIVRLMLQRGVIENKDERWELRKDKLKATKMPGSIVGAAKARMEELGPREREVLEMASVFGPVFWFGGVLSVMRLNRRADEGDDPRFWLEDKTESRLNATLLELQGKDLIEFRSGSGLPNEVSFAFMSAIEQQRLAAGIPPERRQLYHRMAAQWLEQVAPPESFQTKEVIGWHYEQGADAQNAAAATWAAAWLARSSHQNRRAIDLYRRALDLYDIGHALQRCEIYSELSDVHVIRGEYTEAHTAGVEMLFHSVVIASKTWGGRAYHRLGVVARLRGNYEQAMEFLERAHKLFQDIGDLKGISDSMDDIGNVHWYKGEYGSHREALSCFLKSLSLRRKIGEQSSLALSLGNIGNVHLAGGHVKEAAESFQEALLIRRKLQDQWGLAVTLVGMGSVHFECGRTGHSIECWQEGLTLATTIGNRELYGILQNKLGMARLAKHEIEKAEGHLNLAYDTATEIGDKRTLSETLCNKAALAAKRQLFDRALTLVKEAVAAAQSIHGKQLVGTALRTQGEILADQLAANASTAAVADADKVASECFQRSMNFFDEMGDTLGLAHTMRSYGNFLMDRGVVNKARKLLAKAEDVLRHVSS